MQDQPLSRKQSPPCPPRILPKRHGKMWSSSYGPHQCSKDCLLAYHLYACSERLVAGPQGPVSCATVKSHLSHSSCATLMPSGTLSFIVGRDQGPRAQVVLLMYRLLRGSYHDRKNITVVIATTVCSTHLRDHRIPQDVHQADLPNEKTGKVEYITHSQSIHIVLRLFR